MVFALAIWLVIGPRAPGRKMRGTPGGGSGLRELP